MTRVVAVDGPVAAGKGTLARRLAQHLGYAYLDTGSLYRATALRLLRDSGDPNDTEAAVEAAHGIGVDDLTDPELRAEIVGQTASRVAAMPEVRAALLDFQRRFAGNPPGGAPGAVLDGRDVGTVVCPRADAKLFVTASARVRAHRRYLELREKDEPADEAQVLADLKARDARDVSRADAPLKPAEDADLLDTSNLDIDSAFRVAKTILKRKLAEPEQDP